VCSVGPGRTAEVLGRATAAGVPVRVIGETGGDRLIAAEAFDVAVAEAADAWRNAIPNLLRQK
jgi:hypothetical protein